MTLLSIENLSLSFGSHTVVDKVNLTINKGEMLALVGESGSGKSLTALSCLGLQPPGAVVSGKISLESTEIIHASQTTLRFIRGKRISMIFQEPMTALNPLHTIGKQMMEMWRCGDGGMWNEKKSSHISTSPYPHIHSLLDAVGLSHFKDRIDAYPHQLSGGERQRVMIAMAIANRPDLLIADEPTTAVDVTIQKRILELLKKLQAEMGMAILFITHDLTIVRKMADRVAVMKSGVIVEQGAVNTVFTAPQHAYTKLLLGSEPKGAAAPAPANSPDLMSCHNLNVWFPIKKGLLRRTVGYVKAVKDSTITIPKGSTLGIVGESGSGKTTLGFALLRMLASKGEIRFYPSAPSPLVGEGGVRGRLQGHNPIDSPPLPNPLPQGERELFSLRLDLLSSRQMRPLRRLMQPVFQDPYSSLNPRMNIGQIIEEGLRVHFAHHSTSERERMADEALVEVGLSPDIKQRFPHEFSGGQRQRISIARALVLRPQFIMLDEPTSALDLTIQTQIIELLRNLQIKHGLSYMFISHDLRVVRALAHHIVVMRKGEIVEQGSTTDIFEHPQHDYTRTLIEAAILK